MKAASISELQKELALLEPKNTAALCLRLAKYKKENKEFLSYLLFDSINENASNSQKERAKAAGASPLNISRNIESSPSGSAVRKVNKSLREGSLSKFHIFQ